jgi:hypothetical protein
MDTARGVVTVLGDALCLACRSRKHMLPCLLLALIPSSLLLLDSRVSVYSLLLGFISRMHALGREYPATPQFYDLLVRLKSDAVAATHVDAAIVVASYTSAASPPRSLSSTPPRPPAPAGTCRCATCS